MCGKIKYMMHKNVKDTRDQCVQDIEAKIHESATQKDPSFILSGPWKKFIEEREGVKIFAVNGDWVYTNLSVIYHHGGHGLVHEFIPLDEIWVGTHHVHCQCKNVKVGQPVSDKYFQSTVWHELTELREMKSGESYWEAHQKALQAEIELGLLKDPFADV